MKFGYQGGHLIDNQYIYTNDQFLTLPRQQRAFRT